jgi:hypothetical protein
MDQDVNDIDSIVIAARQIGEYLQRQGDDPLPAEARPVLDGLAETLSAVRYEEEDW